MVTNYLYNLNSVSEGASKECNFVKDIITSAKKRSHRPAMIYPVTWDDRHVLEEERVTFEQLDEKIGTLVAGFRHNGWVAGDRIVILFPPSITLYAVLIALISQRLVPVFVDAGMPKRKILQCISDSRPKAIISIKALLLMIALKPSLWRIPLITVDGYIPMITRSFKTMLLDRPYVEYDVCPCSKDDTGIITFTSGSTGKNKVANRTHGLLKTQLSMLIDTIGFTKGQTSASTFPMSALIPLSFESTYCIPAVTLNRQYDLSRDTFLHQIKMQGLTHIAASPAFFSALCREGPHPDFSQISRIVVGGAPMTHKLARKLNTCFPKSVISLIYGSTEAEPVCVMPLKEFLNSTDRGVNVGRPCSGLELCILDPKQLVIDDDADQYIQLDIDSAKKTQGEVGEIVIHGSHVLNEYFDPTATLRQKVLDLHGRMWHRMGDIGRINENGDVVLLGRASQIGDMAIYPYPIELALNNLEGIYQSAVITPNHGTGLVAVVEVASSESQVNLYQRIRDVLYEYSLGDIGLYKCDRIPMDSRHSSRVERLVLSTRFDTFCTEMTV